MHKHLSSRRRLAFGALAFTVAGVLPSHVASAATSTAKKKTAAKAAAPKVVELNPCPATKATRVAAMKNGAPRATIKVWEQPDTTAQPKWTLAIGDDSHTRVVFNVLEERSGMLLVRVPVRPNGSVGWIQANEVTTYDTPYYVVVQLGKRRLTACNSGRVIQSEKVGIGASNLGVTPTGTYYLLDLIKPKGGSAGPYGPYAFGLSGFSETLFDFGGGDGRLGIHGTNRPTALGTAVSHGCIRLSNTAITKLAKTLYLGTPVLITD